MPEAETLQFTVAGKNLQVTPALREHAERKVKKLLKFFDGDRHAIMADLVLSCQRDRQQAEITLRVGGLIVRGVGNTDDMYVSIDQAVDRIERQIRKFKTRIQQRLQERPRPAAAAEEPASSPEAQEESDQPRVVRVKRFAIKPMTVDEAVLQMELLGHDFFVFTNAATDEVNVLYRRQAGDYGLIEPEF